MMKMKEFIKVPSNVVRNEGVDIDSGTFVMYVKLCQLYFRGHKDKEVIFNHRELMNDLGIKDTRTLRKRIKAMYRAGLIENEVEKYPRSIGHVSIMFNEDSYNAEFFTTLNMSVMDSFGEISDTAMRLLFYYKSYINPNIEKRKYCFAGREHITDKLHIGNTTFTECNKELEKSGLLKIVRHPLTHNFEYNEKDELQFGRYQNHYFVNEKIV